MERFIVFQGDYYEGARLPSSSESFATLDEARTFGCDVLNRGHATEIEIFDCDERRVVETLTR